MWVIPVLVALSCGDDGPDGTGDGGALDGGTVDGGGTTTDCGDPLALDMPRRTGDQVCPSERAVSWPACPSKESSACQDHADCTAGPNGRCNQVGNGGCACEYDQCTTDADCGPGQVCMCGEDPVVIGWAVHTCVTADCASDADCPAGQACVVPRAGTVCESYAPRLYDPPTCTTVHDGCRSDAWCDCQAAGEVCVLSNRHLYCSEVTEIGCW